MRVGEAVWGSGAVFELSLRNIYKSQAYRETFIPAVRFRVWKDFAAYFLFPTTKTPKTYYRFCTQRALFRPPNLHKFTGGIRFFILFVS